MVQMPPNPSALDTLRQFTDDQVLALLGARPDLATPPPGSLPGLAARALTRPSLERALSGLDTFQLQALEAAAVLDHSLLPGPVTAAAVRRALGGKVPADAVRGALTLLKEQLLVLGSARSLRVPAEVFAALGPFPAGLGPSLQETLAQRGDLSDSERELWTARLTSSAELTPVLESAPAPARAVLDLLTWGPPVGSRGGGTERADASPIAWLISRGLLATAGDSHVVLPREIALHLRNGRTHRRVSTTPPPLHTAPPTGFRPALGTAQKFVDSSAGERITEVLQLIDLLIALWEDGGPTLRTGGVGVRELRRIAGELNLPESEAAFLLEVAASAQLIALRDGDESWVPSRERLIWAQHSVAEKWVQLAWAWLHSPRATWLIGQRHQGQIVAPLQPGIDRAWIPHLRQRTLDILARTEPGAVPNQDDIYAQLKWHSPRSAPHELAVNRFLEHAQWLGVLGAGAATTAARALLEATQVLRLTEESVRHALDAGWKASTILDKLTAATRTEVPQPVAYLLRDVERQIGQVRAHRAQSVSTTTHSASASEIHANPNFT